MRIQAAVVETQGGPFTVRDLDLEGPRPEEILVRITAAGICHTDLSMRQIWPEQRLPMVFGHEGTGVVEAVGEAVTAVRPGDTVCLSYRSCGACPQCDAGAPAYCLSAGALNAAGTRADGSTPLAGQGGPVFGSFFGQSSFATYVLTDESNTVKVPADLPPAVAAPLGCSVQTGVGTVTNVLRPEAGTSLVVFGAGSVGLSAVMAAVAAGCHVTVVEPLAARRALAEELGATASVDPAASEDVAAAVRAANDGDPDHAIDTTGRPSVISHAIASLRRRGELALVGIGTADFPTLPVMTKGLRLHGVTEGDADPATAVPQLAALYQEGKLPIDRLITRFPFADIEKAARAAATGQVIKPVLIF
ncbi:NAD(P)-dependent alcohol dehydrogenase [Streptomyces sclerotialus]|uniref:NAD(P)-dependent alcohol dehydrogenase n=1 Tax=Streptomyces sclerotialus TaxID=1957 RepID=UPI0004C968D7